MKSGAPAFGTPEYVKAAFASGQLARRYRLPFRSSNVNASNAPDAQAAYESQMAIWGAVMGGCNILLHGAGWLEGGLTASYEKFIIDVEMLQMFAHLLQPVACDKRRAGARRGARDRARRPLLRHPAHPGPLRQRLLSAAAVGLAQFRDLVGGWRPSTRPGGPTGSTRTRWPPSRRRSWRRTAVQPSTISWRAGPRKAAPTWKLNQPARASQSSGLIDLHIVVIAEARGNRARQSTSRWLEASGQMTAR